MSRLPRCLGQGMTFETALEISSQRGWLARVAPSFRDAVLAVSRVKYFDSGDYVYHVGDTSDGLWCLASGVLGIEVAAGEFHPELRMIRHTGTWYGETAIITGANRVVALRAMQRCTMLHLPKHKLEAILASNPSYWQWIALLAAEHSLLAMQVAEDLMMRDTRQRIAMILLRLSGFVDADGGQTSPIIASQQEIGRICNISRGVLNKVLKDFENSGLIRSTYCQIDLLAPEGLLQFASV